MDSADAWAHPELFQLDQDNVPLAVAGCPPDGFSATGQLWGNPLYRWDYHRNTGYQWWISRMSYCFRLYDVVRIDHFRGFDEYFSIPYGDKDARGGHWEKGPGIDLFRKIEQALGWKQVIAEDLGYMTDSVRHLVYESGFPGMKVLEFAFDSRDSGCASDYLPHNRRTAWRIQEPMIMKLSWDGGRASQQLRENWREIICVIMQHRKKNCISVSSV